MTVSSQEDIRQFIEAIKSVVGTSPLSLDQAQTLHVSEISESDYVALSTYNAPGYNHSQDKQTNAFNTLPLEPSSICTGKL